MVYNRDLFIRLISDYYEFCSRVFWDDDVVYPPPGGWPSITKESMANLKLNGTALDLIRHLPYTTYNIDYLLDVPHIMDHTYIVDYHHLPFSKRIANNDLDAVVDIYGPKPSSCVQLAQTSGRNGYIVVLDTDDGYIYWGDPNGEHDEPEPELNRFLGERFDENEPLQKWRFLGYNVYEPAEFFGLCKQRFRELRWVGQEQQIVSSLRMNDHWCQVDENHAELVEFMKVAGWPGDGEGRDWDRAKFLKLICGSEDDPQENASKEEDK